MVWEFSGLLFFLSYSYSPSWSLLRLIHLNIFFTDPHSLMIFYMHRHMHMHTYTYTCACTHVLVPFLLSPHHQFCLLTDTFPIHNSGEPTLSELHTDTHSYVYMQSLTGLSVVRALSFVKSFCSFLKPINILPHSHSDLIPYFAKQLETISESLNVFLPVFPSFLELVCICYIFIHLVRRIPSSPSRTQYWILLCLLLAGLPFNCFEISPFLAFNWSHSALSVLISLSPFPFLTHSSAKGFFPLLSLWIMDSKRFPLRNLHLNPSLATD